MISNQVIQNSIDELRAITKVDPVSYTHLDVYKRQDQITALIKQINQLGLDPDAILSKAQELYEKYGDQLKESADAAIQENVVEPVKEAVVEGAKSAVRDFVHDMVDSIKSFFARMLP